MMLLTATVLSNVPYMAFRLAPTDSFVVDAPCHRRQEGIAEQGAFLGTVAADPALIVFNHRAEVAGDRHADLDVVRDAVGIKHTAAGQPADRIAAVAGAQRRGGAGTGIETDVTVKNLAADCELIAIEAGHAGWVGEHGGGVLRAGAVACGSQTDVGRADFIQADAACSGRSGQKHGAYAERQGVE